MSYCLSSHCCYNCNMIGAILCGINNYTMHGPWVIIIITILHNYIYISPGLAGPAPRACVHMSINSIIIIYNSYNYFYYNLYVRIYSGNLIQQHIIIIIIQHCTLIRARREDRYYPSRRQAVVQAGLLRRILLCHFLVGMTCARKLQGLPRRVSQGHGTYKLPRVALLRGVLGIAQSPPCKKLLQCAFVVGGKATCTRTGIQN